MIVETEILELALEVRALDTKLADVDYENPVRRGLQRRRMVAATRLAELEGQRGSEPREDPIPAA